MSLYHLLIRRFSDLIFTNFVQILLSNCGSNFLWCCVLEHCSNFCLFMINCMLFKLKNQTPCKQTFPFACVGIFFEKLAQITPKNKCNIYLCYIILQKLAPITNIVLTCGDYILKNWPKSHQKFKTLAHLVYFQFDALDCENSHPITKHNHT